jgi:hypothetical protein
VRFLKDPHFIITPSVTISLPEELNVFDVTNANSVYRITLAADVPDNKRPSKLIYQMESGHVFLILQQINTSINDTIHRVFGFYPAKQGWKVFFKKEVKSRIKDNSLREHDIEISRILTAEQFRAAVFLAIQYSRNKYHLNHFNCYDYAVDIYNAVAGEKKIPKIKRRFFIFGKGGTPCTLYKYLCEQLIAHPESSAYITSANLVAPSSTRYSHHIAGKE